MWGLFGTCISNHELRQLNAQRAQILANLGDFGQNDPTKFKLMKLPSKYDHELRWRYYQPPGVLTQERAYHGHQGPGYQSTMMTPEEGEYLYRIKLVKVGEQVILFYTGANRSSYWPIKDPFVARLLYDHWDELEFEHAEEGRIQEVDADATFDLVRIVAPLALLRQLGDDKRLEDHQLLWIRRGADAAFKKQDALNANRMAP
ncbi:hypothetical protein DSM3645_21477 [Blastopirellula marina DSM 3645]|uniref:Uncharacterized protein n=2 Tax=Blastopirellula marina TaxID=124 RepID=A3ZR89_9BACT|nr:hypothetical protein DSM3645_21477 [Blastopirellula marina DSM 3645]